MVSLARRLGAPTLSQVRPRDPRKLVLLLRSFAGEKFGVLGDTKRGEPGLDVRLAQWFWRYGPVVSVTNPMSGRRNPLGPVWHKVPPQAWQEAVAGLLADSSLVIVIAAGTRGLLQEGEILARHAALTRTLLVNGSSDAAELRAWLSSLPEAMRPEVADADPVLAVAWSADGVPLVLTGPLREASVEVTVRYLTRAC
jgi:hypothetical protein